MLFGTPHHGLRIKELREMILSEKEESVGPELRMRNISNLQILEKLEEGSYFLEEQKRDLINIWEECKPRIVSYYEMRWTPNCKKSKGGNCKRDGPNAEMVKWYSAQLF
ncbi:hypothetical protein BDD12DRAFT_891946 [Trichophaea hybrida]|nr:hypothetical protein BDD12DRAFT_891946 [Trichophaea hybrida]